MEHSDSASLRLSRSVPHPSFEAFGRFVEHFEEWLPPQFTEDCTGAPIAMSPWPAWGASLIAHPNGPEIALGMVVDWDPPHRFAVMGPVLAQSRRERGPGGWLQVEFTPSTPAATEVTLTYRLADQAKDSPDQRAFLAAAAQAVSLRLEARRGRGGQR